MPPRPISRKNAVVTHSAGDLSLQDSRRVGPFVPVLPRVLHIKQDREELVDLIGELWIPERRTR